jgi:hypothetical protein
MRKGILILLVVVLGLVGGIIGHNIWKTNLMQIPAKAPSDLTAEQISATEVKLIWKDPNNELGFVLFRDGEEIAVLLENTRSYEDSGLRPATSYRYEIKAYNLVGESDIVACTVKTLNPPIQIWLEKIGVHENGEEGESFRQLWDMIRGQEVTGEVQVLFVITDNKTTSERCIPDKDYYPLEQDEILPVHKLLFATGEVGENIRLLATAYEQDGGFKEGLMYRLADMVTGLSLGTPTSLLLDLSGVDFSEIYAQICGAEDDWLGSYESVWNGTENWGVGSYADIQCKRENGHVGLRLWFTVVCPAYNYSAEATLLP